MTRPTALVVGVGAEQGLGAALGRRFAVEGRHVLLAGRTAGKSEQVARRSSLVLLALASAGPRQAAVSP